MPIQVSDQQAPDINGEKLSTIQILELNIYSQETSDGSQPIPVSAEWKFNLHGKTQAGNRVYKRVVNQVLEKCSLPDFYSKGIAQAAQGDFDYMLLNYYLNKVLAKEIAEQKRNYSSAIYVPDFPIPGVTDQ